MGRSSSWLDWLAQRRVPAAALLAGIAGSLMQCDAGQPFQPTPDAGRLTVAPNAWTDSAAAGSRALRSMTMSVGAHGVGGLPWHATLRQQSAWLTLGTVSGWAPVTVTVSADPHGLVTGTYRDTIVLARTDGMDGQVLVPVAFQIHPCAVTAIAIDVELTDSLRESSCGAPHRAGSFAQLYGFSAEEGDSISIELIPSGFEGYIVLTGAAATIPVAEAEGCEGGGGNTCLRYQLLSRSGPYVIEATSAGAGAAGRFTLRATKPRAPPLPSELGQFRADASSELGVGQETREARVVLSGAVTDLDSGDSLHLEVEVKGIDQPFDGSVSGTSDVAGAGARAVVHLDLADGDYRWRARTRDYTGRTSAWASYGGNAAEAADFRVAVQQAPAMPATLEQITLEGRPIETGGLARETVLLRGLVADENAGDRLRLEVELQSLNDPFTNIPTATSELVANGTIASVLISGLQDSVSYHWQARAVDESNKPGSWAVFGANAESAPDFAVALPPAGLIYLNQPVTASAGALLAPVRIAAVDAAGRVLKSFGGTISVALHSQSGAGMLSGATTAAAVAGVATFSDLRIEQTGEQYALTASAAGLPVLASAAFDVSAAAASRLIFTTPPTSLAAGELFSAIQVKAVDSFGNTVTGFAGQVTLTVGPPGALAGTTTVSATAGVALFADIRIETAGQGYALTATAAGIPEVVSPSFNVMPGSATQLSFASPPTAVIAGGTIAVEVVARDGFGNTATTFSEIVTIGLGPSGSLGGSTSVSAVAGIAAFRDLLIMAVGDSYTLTAEAAGIAQVVSPVFRVSAGAAEQLVFTSSPSSTIAGQVLDVQLAVRDAFDNTVSGFTGPVTVALGPSGALTGATTINAVAGIATFAGLTVQAAGGDYTLTATAHGIPAVVSPSFSVSPAGASHLVFTTPPSSATAGSVLTLQLTAQDAFGNTATGFTGAVTLALGPTGALAGTSTVTAVAGVATFTDVSISAAGEGYTLIATASGVAGVVSPGFAIGPASAAELVFSTLPGSVTAGALLAVQLTARDAFGNTATGFTGEVILHLGPSGALQGTSTVAAVAGVATFADLRIEQSADGYALTASTLGMPDVTSGSFAVSPGSATQLVFTSSPSSTIAGAIIAVQLTARDAFGNTATGFTGQVTLSLDPTGALNGTSTLAAVAGIATFADLRIAHAADGYALTAGAAGLPDVASPRFDVRPGTAAQLVFATPLSPATAGTMLAVQLIARDAFGNTATSFTGQVTLTLAPSGTLAGTTTVSAVAGIAMFSNLNIQQAGTGYTLTASAGGIPSIVSPSFTVNPGTATQLAFTTPPSSTTAGAVLAVQVTARDVFGNIATGFTGAVTLSLEPAGTLGGTTAVSAVAGIATFTDLNIEQAGAGYALTASGSGIPNTVSPSFSVSPGAATQLAFTIPPSSTTAGTTIPVELTARDAFGNRATGFSGAVTLNLGPSGTLDGATTVTAVAGIATFADLAINQAAAAYAITASAPGLPNIASPSFSVNPGGATQLVFTTPLSAATAGAVLTVQVTARDAFGNTATSFTGQVTLALGPSGTLGGTTAVNALAGVATFADLTIEQSATGYALTAAATGIPDVISSSFSIAPGAATKLVFTTPPPGSTTAGTVLLVELAVQDAFGNLVPGFSGPVTLDLTPGTATLSGTITGMAVAGIATFSDISIEQSGVGYALIATAAGLSDAVSHSFSVSAGPATKLVFTTAPGSTTAGAVIPVQLTAYDELDNVATGSTAPVTLTLGPSGTLAGTTTVVPIDGTATFSDLHVDVAGVNYTLTASAAAVASVVSPGFDVSPGPAVRVTLSPAWLAVIPGDSLKVTAAAMDEFGNAAGAPVVLEVEHPATASISSAGWVRGMAFGSTRVIARTGTVSAATRTIVAPPQLVGAGDIALCSRNTDEATAALLDTIPGIVFTAGDNAYPDGTAADFADCYHPSWGRHLERTRPAPGNHDYESPDAAPYYAYFGAQAGDTGRGYYSFNFAGWHVISLNSELPMTSGTPQEQWLRADLAANPAMCTVAIWHHPLFSSGRHGNISRSRAAWRALIDARAELVIVGHDHTYERFAPQTSTAVPDPVNGLRQFVVGTGGADFYEFPTIQPNSEVRDATSHGVLVLTLRADGYDWRFVPVAGDTFTDSGSGDCH